MILEQEVGDSLVSQVNAMVAAGRWPRDPPPAGHMRGIDFYNQTDLMVALIVGAQIFKDSQGYIPPLAAPVTYTERLFARKFFAPLPMPSLADKLEGQAYVRARMGEAFVPSVVWGRGKRRRTLRRAVAGRPVRAEGQSRLPLQPGPLATGRPRHAARRHSDADGRLARDAVRF
jgi:hypothetical protein